MRLVELVPTPDTDPEILDRLETFLTTTLGKGVIRAKDTPNFVANRVGVFSMLATMHHTLAFNLGFDEVDALTGPAIGRAKSATYRTADVVGLDTMAHVIKTMARHAARPIRGPAYYEAPAWLARAGRQGRARPQDQGRHLQPARQGLLRARRRAPGLPALRRRGGRRGAGDPQGEGSRAAAREAPREPASAGAVPLGHLPRSLPLLRGAPGRDRPLRARRGSRRPLGLRLAARAVRVVAGRGLAAGGASGSPRTSRPARRWRTCRCPRG